MRTQGRYGAVKTSNPKNDSRVSGFRLDQIYTNVLDSADPRNGILVVKTEDIASSERDAYNSSHEKTAGDVPDPCSSSREYRVMKKTWKRRSSEGGPK